MSIVAEPVRAGDRAYATLLEEIQSGILAPGAVLAETEQAARLGVSRTPLRRALQQLTADGLVVQQSPRVTVVSGIAADDIRALFEIRRSLEESAARLAAARGDGATFETFADEFGRVRFEPVDEAENTSRAARRHGADDARDAYYALIARFDGAIDAAVANDYFTAALRTVRTHLVRVRRLARDKPERLAESVSEHRLIAEAIAAGDGDLAAHATHVHLHNALEGILDSLSDSEGTA